MITLNITGQITCGNINVRSAARGRIIGGLEVNPPHKMPWMVKLGSAHNKSCGRCGGTLITSQHVMTAGHCVHYWDKNKVPSIFRIHNILKSF